MDTNHYERLLAAIHQHNDLGWISIPLKGKQPIISDWDGFAEGNPTLENQLNAFEKVRSSVTGIGIITGYMESLAVLDLEAGEDFSKHNIPKCPTSLSGGNGRHYYFKFPETLEWDDNGIPLRKFGIEGDLKLNKGYIVAPPSIHPKTGNEYKWLNHPLESEMPSLPEWLVEMYKSNKTLTGGTDWGNMDLIEVNQGERHSTAMSVAGKLVSHLPEEDWETFALQALLAWNQGACKPPMDEKELAGVFNSVCKMQRQQRISKQITQSQVATTIPRSIKTLSIKELYALSESEKPLFVIDKLIPENGISYMFGLPGSAKSMVMLEMAKAIAGGTLFLDKFETRQKNILIVDEENGNYELKRRASLLRISEDLPLYINSLNSFKFDDEQAVIGLIKLCKEKEIGMTIFDPFISMHNAEENSATEMQKIMEVMQRFNLEGITVLFIHHSRKGGFGTGAQNSRGSSAINGRADSTLIIERMTRGQNELITVRQTKSRRGKATDPIQIILSQEAEESPIQLTYDGDIGESVVKKDQAKEASLDALKESPLLRKDLIQLVVDITKIGSRNVGTAIKELEDENKITFKMNGREKEYSLTACSMEMEI